LYALIKGVYIYLSTSKCSIDVVEYRKGILGTPNYMAPEVIQKLGHSYNSDIWALGCIMLVLITVFLIVFFSVYKPVFFCFCQCATRDNVS